MVARKIISVGGMIVMISASTWACSAGAEIGITVDIQGDKDDAHCNVNPDPEDNNVAVTTRRANKESPLVSKVHVNRDHTGRTDVEGVCHMYLNNCGTSRIVRVKPNDTRFCGQESACKAKLDFKLQKGCKRVNALLEGDANHIPWAPVLTRLFRSQFGEDVFGEDRQIAEDYVEIVTDLYSEDESVGDLRNTVELSRDMTQYFLEMGLDAAAYLTATLELDAMFRALGLDPATEEAPLLVEGEEGFILSEQGREILAYLPDGDSIGEDPVVLPSDTIRVLDSPTFEDRTPVHPNFIEDMDEYLSPSN